MQIKIPEKKCGDCRFFAMGEDADAFCRLYNNSWDMTEADCEEADSDKPAFCDAIYVVVVNDSQS